MNEMMFEDFFLEGQTEILATEEVVEVVSEFKDLQEKLGFEFEKVEDIPTKVLDKFLTNLNPELRDVAELMFLGKDVSKQELQKLLTISEDNSVFDNEANARVYLRAKLVDSIGEDDIDEYLDTLEDKSKLLDKATDLKTKDLAESKNLMKKEVEIRNKNKQEEELKFLTQLNSEFENLSWSNEVKENVTKISHPEVSNKILTEIYNNPSSYLQFLGILSTYKDGKFDLGTFATQADSKKNQSIKQKLEQRQGEYSGGSSKTKVDLSKVREFIL
jgi:hypothetical protein